ncbi:uncharacterized protein Gasu_47690 [Galdieria sulphuraria]|uniref:Uncharacterized protein n=1 Tax=Galdieria sulphuraria TaxID=130081 RepID=M2XVD4_GALSU|nr:uncharacterized protein Gasu_47690 [Galdieria sulphuraria]EME27623.1 hypothetical protein Gasu_47690 [Galdieria sulphuraria]|eukprot:XP_005704143.1 hypothetical protein Gasu_47690 [Galdieria sulphuraria]
MDKFVSCFALSFDSTLYKQCFRFWSKSFIKPLPYLNMIPTSSCNSAVCTYGGFLLSGVTQSCDSVFGRFVDFEIFLPFSFKIDKKKYSIVWRMSLPDLSEDCRLKTVASIVGEKVQVGEKYLKLGKKLLEILHRWLFQKNSPMIFQ